MCIYTIVPELIYFVCFIFRFHSEFCLIPETSQLTPRSFTDGHARFHPRAINDSPFSCPGLTDGTSWKFTHYSVMAARVLFEPSRCVRGDACFGGGDWGSCVRSGQAGQWASRPWHLEDVGPPGPIGPDFGSRPECFSQWPTVETVENLDGASHQ